LAAMPSSVLRRLVLVWVALLLQALEGAEVNGTGLNRSQGLEPGGNVSDTVLSELGFETDSDAEEVLQPSADLRFQYHKAAFPLDWHHDGLSFLLASVGLIIAASGGIGGGGILVPLFILVLGFRPKHAIALSNFTILGGSIANTVVNVPKRHPRLKKGLIDWDLILIMEPLTIFGAVFGSLLSKVLPNVVLTVSLSILLGFMGQRTLFKGIRMWRDESRLMAVNREPSVEMLGIDGEPTASRKPALEAEAVDEDSYLELHSDGDFEGGFDRSEPSSGSRNASGQRHVGRKVAALILCLAGTCALTILKGGGSLRSPFGFPCGSVGYWLLYFVSVPWVLAFAFYFRHLLLAEFEEKMRKGHTFEEGEVKWDRRNTIKYPILCTLAGLMAGLFGVGGGIVKGPLMLEMGIIPAVASASAAAMILFTSAAASTSFLLFGLLHTVYGAIFFTLGLICTAAGQCIVGHFLKGNQRQSPIVLSIGLVIVLSSLFVAINTAVSSAGVPASELLRIHGVCSSDS